MRSDDPCRYESGLHQQPDGFTSTLRSYRNKFYKDYGELVLCYDSKHYWRRKEFPHYKGTRKKDREKSNFDWHEIFEVLNKIRDEIREHLPYKVVEVDGAEADDIIATLVKDQGLANIRLQNNMQPPRKVLILSGDKDFQQLQKYKFVDQYNPIQKKFVQCEDPKQYIAEHILKGDDITFKNYERNQKLIDFEFIPKEVNDNIINTFENTETPARGKMYPYFMRHALNEMLDHITEF